MTPTAQRIAIAEALGYINIDPVTWTHGFRDKPERVVPDFPSDLNAMHEAEKGLTIMQSEKYINELLKLLNISDKISHLSLAHFAVCHAIATQRAEAFLRTINKWDDSK